MDDVDFDDIKRRKRQSPFTKNQPKDKIISETVENFKEALNLNEIVEIPKIQIHREKRELMINTTLNLLHDLDLPYALPKEKEKQGN